MAVNAPPINANSPPRSCLYECRVMHHRLAPKENRFTYHLFFFYLDLDDIPSVCKKIAGFSHNKFNLYSFRDRDHLTVLGGGSVKQNLAAYLSQHGVHFPENGRAILLTLPRVLGYIFNPVSFYFCFDTAGVPLCAVAQVGNTFGEMKPYLVARPGSDGVFRLRTPKHFYVSPFSALDLDFDFKLRPPGEELEIHIDDWQGETRILLSSLTGTRVPLTTARLVWLTLKFPLVTLKVIFLIHWQALLLWLKRLPYHSKAANKHLQSDVLNPHHSIVNETP
jgi:DUF1365 family protein